MGLLSDKELEDYLSLQDINHYCSPPSSSIDGHTDIDALSEQKEPSDAPVLNENNVEASADDSVVQANETTNCVGIIYFVGQVLPTVTICFQLLLQH